MKRYRVRPTESAIADADEAFHWLHLEAPEAAYTWYEGLFAAFDSLQTNPRRCSRAPEGESQAADIRHLFYGTYRIIFQISSDAVYIVHVRHSARRPLGNE